MGRCPIPRLVARGGPLPRSASSHRAPARRHYRWHERFTWGAARCSASSLAGAPWPTPLPRIALPRGDTIAGTNGSHGALPGAPPHRSRGPLGPLRFLASRSRAATLSLPHIDIECCRSHRPLTLDLHEHAIRARLGERVRNRHVSLHRHVMAGDRKSVV